MHTIYINDTSKYIEISDDFYIWMRDISDPCVLTYDDEIDAETIDSADFMWWSNAFKIHTEFETVYASASEEHKKLVDEELAYWEADVRAAGGLAMLIAFGY